MIARAVRATNNTSKAPIPIYPPTAAMVAPQGSRSALVHLMVVVSYQLTVARAEMHLAPLDAYLHHFDGMGNLPVLDVRYGDAVVQGQLFVNRKGRPKNKVLLQIPTVTWDPSSLPCGLLLFIDLDAGGYTAPGTSAGKYGPFVHALWSHCKGGFNAGKSCNTRTKYLPPGHMGAVPNRYAFILFRHDCSATLKLPTEFRFSKDRLSLANLLSENPGLAPVAATFLRAGSSATE
jgi:hypothetical protein